MERLDGKSALVTGGASGIGRAVVQRLARAGASVTLVDVDDRGGREVADAEGAAFVLADVGHPDELQDAVDRAVARHGPLHIAHLNAGVSTGENDVTRLTVAAYERALSVNLGGVVFGTKAVAPAMTGGGSIVVTASLAGLVAYPTDFMYGATKHAVIGFVRAVAEQLQAAGITINALCPGFVDTPILGPFADEFRRANFPLLQPGDVAEAFVRVLGSGRTGEVFICQPGLLCEPYRFRGVPGPRAEGAEGKPPPVFPGHPAR